MEYLVKLVTPPKGTCIDIFMGAGSTGIACSNLGFNFIGVEIEPQYFEIAKTRIKYWEDNENKIERIKNEKQQIFNPVY